MLQNARIAAFTISELFRENQQRGKITAPLPLSKLGLKTSDMQETEFKMCRTWVLDLVNRLALQW